MSYKFTYKKHPRETGRASVMCPHPTTDIKHDGKCVGVIQPPVRRHNNKWTIRVMVQRTPTPADPCTWRWISVMGVFDTEPAARKHLDDNAQTLIMALKLYHQED